MSQWIPLFLIVVVWLGWTVEKGRGIARADHSLTVCIQVTLIGQEAKEVGGQALVELLRTVLPERRRRRERPGDSVAESDSVALLYEVRDAPEQLAQSLEHVLRAPIHDRQAIPEAALREILEDVAAQQTEGGCATHLPRFQLLLMNHPHGSCYSVLGQSSVSRWLSSAGHAVADIGVGPCLHGKLSPSGARAYFQPAGGLSAPSRHEMLARMASEVRSSVEQLFLPDVHEIASQSDGGLEAVLFMRLYRALDSPTVLSDAAQWVEATQQAMRWLAPGGQRWRIVAESHHLADHTHALVAFSRHTNPMTMGPLTLRAADFLNAVDRPGHSEWAAVPRIHVLDVRGEPMELEAADDPVWAAEGSAAVVLVTGLNQPHASFHGDTQDVRVGSQQPMRGLAAALLRLMCGISATPDAWAGFHPFASPGAPLSHAYRNICGLSRPLALVDRTNSTH